MVSKLSMAVMATLREEVDKQSSSIDLPNRNWDPTYPTFRFESGHRYLMYIPKVDMIEDGMPIGTYYTDEKGVEHENIDAPYIHRVLETYHKDGKESTYTGLVRCVNGLHLDDLGYNGDCPLCEVSVDCNKLIAEAVRESNPGDLSTKEWVDEARKYDNYRLVTGINGKDPERSRYHVFPIGVIEVKGGMNSLKVVGEPEMYFYQSSSSNWKRWREAIENVLGEDAMLPGNFFYVSYPQGDKMMAGRDVSIMLLNPSSVNDTIEAFGRQFDNMFQGKDADGNDNGHPWTLDKVYEKVSACKFETMTELQRRADVITEKNTLFRIQLGLAEQSEANAVDAAPKAEAGITATSGGIGGRAKAPDMDASDIFGLTDDPADAKADDAEDTEAPAATVEEEEEEELSFN